VKIDEPKKHCSFKYCRRLSTRCLANVLAEIAAFVGKAASLGALREANENPAPLWPSGPGSGSF
jgi:hypothetical protein